MMSLGGGWNWACPCRIEQAVNHIPIGLVTSWLGMTAPKFFLGNFPAVKPVGHLPGLIDRIDSILQRNAVEGCDLPGSYSFAVRLDIGHVVKVLGNDIDIGVVSARLQNNPLNGFGNIIPGAGVVQFIDRRFDEEQIDLSFG